MTPSGLAPVDPARQPEHVARPDVPTPSAAGEVPASGQFTVPSPASAPHVPETAADAPGPLLTSGTAADVFALDEDRVLRRYRSGRDASDEAAILSHVVAAGFPAPTVLASEGPDIVLERLHGPTLLQALAAEEMSLHDGAEVLADLHRQLHEVPAPDGWSDTAPSHWPVVSGGPSVVHLDLHPGNVILSDRHGPVLVDWTNARTGTAELDVAVTALIIAEVAVDAGGVYSQAARALLASFLQATDVDVLAELDGAVAVRSADPSLVPGERELVPAAAVLVRELVEVARHPQ